MQEQKALEKKVRSLQKMKSRSVGISIDSRRVLMSNLKSELHANNSITGIQVINYEPNNNKQVNIIDIND